MIALKQYPHVVYQIESLWSWPEFSAFVEKLLIQESGATRIGFSPDAFSELLFLAETHKMIYGY